ncbi:hypothetical protein [Endozoicomonas ascidiicola]|uniref:hypothetical protein n=1 Tax=Endozoicomonas ascidiicola TaxID=1698521 RepID=UPI000832C04A|nr:hypothetical protein [Endozoicomonas ascidiicola]
MQSRHPQNDGDVEKSRQQLEKRLDSIGIINPSNTAARLARNLFITDIEQLDNAKLMTLNIGLWQIPADGMESLRIKKLHKELTTQRT